jgi:hypothetical protein
MVDTKIHTTSYKFCSFELSSVICQNPPGMLNLYMMLCRNFTTASCVIFTTGIASIHLVNVSITTNKNLKPPDALGKMPMKSIPQIAKGQERSIDRRVFVCFVVCFWKNWQSLHLMTTSITSSLVAGQYKLCLKGLSMIVSWQVWSAYTAINILKQLNAFFSGDTLHHHAICASPI